MRFQIIKVMLFQLCRNPVPLKRHLARFRISFGFYISEKESK